MSNLVLAVVSGIALGGIYAIVSMGLVLGFRATGTFNFAHGQMMAMGAFIVGSLQADSGLSLAVVVPLAAVLMAALGAVFYLVVLQRTIGMPHFMGVIATFGLAVILDAVMSMRFGERVYRIAIPGMPRGAVEILGTRVRASELVIAASTLVLIVATTLVLRRTRLGTQVRAAGQDPLLAAHGGVNVRVIYLASWALVGVLCLIAGIGYASLNSASHSIVVLAFAVFPAVLLGGLDSLEGAAIGGVLVGLLQSMVAIYWGGEYVDVVTYSVLLLVMLVLPSGLLGTRVVERV